MAHRTVEVACPVCGATRPLRPYDAARTSCCRACHARQIASLGWEATKARWGEKCAVEHQRRYRLDHPSDLERTVIGWLRELGVSFEREVMVLTNEGRCWLLDFQLPAGGVVEVNGEFAHAHHVARDAAKRAWVLDQGLPLLWLSEDDVTSGRGRALLAAFAEGGG